MNRSRFMTWLLFSCLLPTIADPAKILGIFPTTAKSHFAFDIAIMRHLADAGHEITVLCPFPQTNYHKNIRIIDTRLNVSSASTARFTNTMIHKISVLTHFRNIQRSLTRDCVDFANSPTLQNFLSSGHVQFDVMFVHMLPMYECYLVVAQKFRIPVIGTVTFRQFAGIDAAVGNPHHLTLPFTSCRVPQQATTFAQRLKNTYCHLVAKIFYDFEITEAVRRFYRENYASHANSASDSRVSLLFSNNHPCLLAKPSTPNVVEIGGVHITQPSPLPQDLEKFVADAEHGVILFSMGSILGGEVIDAGVRQIFKNTFAELRQRVIWKFDEPIADVSANVLVRNWIPQLDVLAHPNVKAFVSHCGIGGAYEAMYTGTPMILLPVFGDQPSNAQFLHGMEVGVYVELDETLTTTTLLNAINAVLNDDRYVTNMRKYSKIFRDHPIPQKKSVVYWTEYVLRYNGTEHVDVSSRYMPLFRYLLFDTLLLWAALVITTFYVIICLLRTVFRAYLKKIK